MATDSRRVSLPASLVVSHPHHSTYHQYSTGASGMLLSPHFSQSPCTRRSLPSTPLPNGGRRSLPPTPPTPAFSSASEHQQFFVDDDEKMEESQDNEIRARPRTNRLRSFDFRDGHLLDKGFQKKPENKLHQESPFTREDSRRATCPDIFLFDTRNHLIRHVVLRIYGHRNCGKKSLANRIHHFANSRTPERVDADPDNNNYTNITTFLLNGKEISLEILLESTLENSPFQQSKTIYVVMYNVDSRSSFLYANHILERIKETSKMDDEIPAFLIANKIDLKRIESVSSAEGRSTAKMFKCEFLEVSALLGMNTEETWKAILQNIQEPGERRRPSWVERLLNHGKDVAKSAEEVFHRIIS